MPDRARIDALTETANDLIQEINKLNTGTGKSVESLNTKMRRNKHIMWVVIASLIVDIAITVGLTLTVNNTQQNSERIDKITQRLDYNANVQRKKVLCPLYEIFVNSRSEAGKAQYPQGPEAYDKTFDSIQGQYDALNCTN